MCVNMMYFFVASRGFEGLSRAARPAGGVGALENRAVVGMQVMKGGRDLPISPGATAVFM